MLHNNEQLIIIRKIKSDEKRNLQKKRKVIRIMQTKIIRVFNKCTYVWQIGVAIKFDYVYLTKLGWFSLYIFTWISSGLQLAGSRSLISSSKNSISSVP